MKRNEHVTEQRSPQWEESALIVLFPVTPLLPSQALFLFIFFILHIPESSWKTALFPVPSSG